MTMKISRGCCECVSDPGDDQADDPITWCDCRADEPPCNGPCKQRAHDPADCPRPFLRCDRCNYDEHTCPGCGEPLEHGVEVCSACASDTRRR